MEKLEKIIPDKIPVHKNNVVVSEKAFNNFVNIINAQIDAINDLIDIVEALQTHDTEANTKIINLQNSLQTLANALQTYMED